MIAFFTAIIAKLHRDKENLKRLIKSMSVQSSEIIVKRDNSQNYENIELHDQKAATKTADIELKENPAYSTIKDM